MLETVNAINSQEIRRGINQKIKKVCQDLSYLKSVVENWTGNPIEDIDQKELKELVKQFREAAYESEDALGDFLIQEIKYESMGTFFKLAYYFHHSRKPLSLLKKFEPINEKVEKIMKIEQDRKGSSKGPKPKTVPMIEEEHVMGFDGEAETVRDLLTRGTDDLEVISIIGMGGLGKTTLARKIYCDSIIEYEFYKRIWVCVSKDRNAREVFFTILSRLGRATNDMHEMSDEDLSEAVYRSLKRDKYLIVLDDVWQKTDWDTLQKAFPKNKKGSRILITSRNEDVARHANPKTTPHKLKLLTRDESHKLLNLKAFGSEECPYEDLVITGHKIASECGGLPLVITMIGRILREKGTEIEQWIDVSKNFTRYINMDPEQIKDKLIALSFYQLPYSLKPCFLYFGLFPKDYLIPVRKLTRLWIAEGFIERNGDMDLEEIAEEYLKELVQRSLVTVGELRSNGKIKTCHVHDMVRAFCMERAGEENLYHVVRQFDPSTYVSSNLDFQMYRRICIHSRVLNYLNCRDLASPNIRSFLCSSCEETTLTDEQIYHIPKMFKLLRVLDGKPLAFPKFPGEISRLFHLRYLVLSIKFNILPKAISHLWNLQTLVVHTTSRTLEIKGDKLKLVQLRHLETNVPTSWPALSKGRGKKEQLVRNENLTTLSTISPETCTQDAFERVPNLKKLGIRGRLAKMLNGEDSSCSIDNLMKLEFLENLKLINDLWNQKNKIICLPDEFPPYLKKLTLKNTQLDWLQTSILGKLENLEVLKLKENAFRGKFWLPTDAEFPALEVLHIRKANLAYWVASDSPFPKLRHLSLHHCNYLRDIQLCPTTISSLESVDLLWTTASAVASVKKIQELTRKGKGFKLSVYPTEHLL